MDDDPLREPRKREPVFNPRAFEAMPVIVLVTTMVAIHFWIDMAGAQTQYIVYRDYAFFSVRLWQGEDLLGLVSHAFLHGSWAHLLMNMFALFALGTVCWKRMGTANFFAFFGITAAAGALAFAAIRPGETEPLVGASGAIFGLLAAFKYMQFAMVAERGVDVRRDAILFLLQITVLNFVLGLATGGMMAWEAHFGGLAIGWFITPYMMEKRR
jgi:membrane associated rhomboid family serine protease